jgi:fructose-1-phosphate kinase PfkB-like protein
VVLTRGAEGAIAIDRDGGAFRVAGPAVRGPYPVGSGDAFLAGLAVGRLRAASFVDALRLAGAAAAANAIRRGAGRLDLADVERIAGSINVGPIED